MVEGLKNNLMGLPAITALKLATRLDYSATMDHSQSLAISFKIKFPKVFKGLGNLEEAYDIKLKPDAKRYAICPMHTLPCHVALPLRKKIIEELNQTESLGIITRVDEPTPWCACGNGSIS